jgi:hypothetical protein
MERMHLGHRAFHVISQAPWSTATLKIFWKLEHNPAKRHPSDGRRRGGRRAAGLFGPSYLSFFADHDVSADKILAVATAGTQPDRHVDRLEVLSKIFWKLFILWNRLVNRQRRPTDHSMPA